MKRRVFAMLLVLALSVSMLTVGATAIVPKSIELERRNSEQGDNWAWNGRTQTLFLEGGMISAEDGIYIDCDATIVVRDDTFIQGYFVVDGELTIEGDSELFISTDTTALTVEEDVLFDEAVVIFDGVEIGVVCGGTVTAEYSEIFGMADAVIVAEEDINIYDSLVSCNAVSSVLFAEGDVRIEWGEIYAVSLSAAIYAGEDVTIEASILTLQSNVTSAIWAGDDIRLRDCDLEDELYEDELDAVGHPLFSGFRDVTALFYEDDDEFANEIYAEASISAFADVFMLIATLDEGRPGEYNDVSSRDWFSDAVDYVSRKGLMIGTGRKTFSPNETVSNAMAWMILARINDAYTVGNAYWYDAAQNFVVTNGLSDGINPNGAITREAFITMLFKSNGSYCVRDLSGYADAASISADAIEPMRWAVENGIIKGVDGKLNPKGYMTRAELAEILMRLG